MFKRLSTELAFTYTALFSAVVALIAVIAWLARLAQSFSVLSATVLVGAASLASLLFGSWLISRRIAGPISALRAAVSRLARGEPADVKIFGRNEIAALATSFNAMSGEVAAREQRIIRRSQHDAETGLPNLRALEARLAELRAGMGPQEIFAAAISIDRFQHLRGAIGHGLSSRLISEIAARISASYSELFVGRLSSNVVGLVFHAESADAAIRTVLAAAGIASQPMRLGEDRIEVLVTAGVACDADGADLDPSLPERAEIAIDQARSQGIRAAAFDPAAYGDPPAAMSLMSSLMLGLGRGEIFLAYQPQYDLRAGTVSSAEALVRWRHPQHGLISPDRFIAMAEETGHIRPLTDWVIDRAIADQRVLRQAGSDIPLSINVSGRLMASEAFAERALRQIRRADARLRFEITERAVTDNPKLALDIIGRLGAAGVELSIDDYGSTLSSLSCLRTIPAQELKLDKAFVQGMARGNSDALLVKSTIDLAHSLGMRIAAEGVETAEAFSLLQAMGADLAQGFHIARPMPLDELVKFETPRQEAQRAAPALKGLA